MKKFKVFYGLAGGFGGAKYGFTAEVESEDEAEDLAYEYACDKYESYTGLHGLDSWDNILESLNNNEYRDEPLSEDNEEDCDIVDEFYNQSRENWLDYYVEEVSDDE